MGPEAATARWAIGAAGARAWARAGGMAGQVSWGLVGRPRGSIVAAAGAVGAESPTGKPVPGTLGVAGMDRSRTRAAGATTIGGARDASGAGSGVGGAGIVAVSKTPCGEWGRCWALGSSRALGAWEAGAYSGPPGVVDSPQWDPDADAPAEGVGIPTEGASPGAPGVVTPEDGAVGAVGGPATAALGGTGVGPEAATARWAIGAAGARTWARAGGMAGQVSWELIGWPRRSIVAAAGAVGVGGTTGMPAPGPLGVTGRALAGTRAAGATTIGWARDASGVGRGVGGAGIVAVTNTPCGQWGRCWAQGASRALGAWEAGADS